MGRSLGTRLPPALAILYMYCTSSTECFSCTSSSHSEYASVCFCLMMVVKLNTFKHLKAWKILPMYILIHKATLFNTVDFNSPSLNTVVVHSSILPQVEIIQSTTRLISHRPGLIHLWSQWNAYCVPASSWNHKTKSLPFSSKILHVGFMCTEI